MITTNTEKIREQGDKVVYRLDLIGETADDKADLKKLENETLEVIDLAVLNIVQQKAEELIETLEGDWDYMSEKIFGKPSFYLSLKPSVEESFFK